MSFGHATRTGLDSQEKPRRCALAAENDALTEEIRQLIYGKSRNKYRILFTIREDTVFVLHVRHRSQAPLTSEEIDEEVHAISEEPKKFYEKCGFISSPVAPMTMLVTVADAKAALDIVE
ncbi:type II toxin-antitoxin system RelE/ParE family toxin [Scytonema sp. PCC 10023]|uniref:type II toxin-antitoxin system RelE/ParE family toxin n=1 Tax=Scytonema sp. PCC 10023 TaxID=1680591 RepID=UPI0039C61702